MNTYIIKSQTNYGETILIINATSLEEASQLADAHPHSWAGFEIEQLDTKTFGEVFFGGGDCG